MEGGYTDLEMGQESAEGLELEETWDPFSVPASPCHSPTMLLGRDILYLKLLAWKPSGNCMLTFFPRSSQVSNPGCVSGHVGLTATYWNCVLPGSSQVLTSPVLSKGFCGSCILVDWFSDGNTDWLASATSVSLSVPFLAFVLPYGQLWRLHTPAGFHSPHHFWPQTFIALFKICSIYESARRRGFQAKSSFNHHPRWSLKFLPSQIFV